MHVGILVAHGPSSDAASLKTLGAAAAALARPELERAAGISVSCETTDPLRLANDEPRRPSDFLDEAALQMAEGAFDFVIVLTDITITVPRRGVVPGLASPASGIAIISTRRLVSGGRGRPVRDLDDPPVRLNAAALWLHLVGHLLHLPHELASADNAMAPFRFDPSRTSLPRYSPRAQRLVRERVRKLEPALIEGGLVRRAWFHLASAARHSRTVAAVLLRNRAPLLPLALPSLATAAVAPTFLLMFTAEIWDAGLNMPNGVVWLFASASILASSWYLTAVQDLFFPREEKRRLSEHMAVVNVAILGTVVLALIGLFVMVALLMLVVATYIFPPGLIATWPTLEDPQVDLSDKLRLSAFISVIGVLTGSLAGGLESRAVIRNLALFLREP